MHKREEEFRRADNERMRRFFNARFDDIPAAFQQNAGKDSLTGARGGPNSSFGGGFDNGLRGPTGADRSTSQPLNRQPTNEFGRGENATSTNLDAAMKRVNTISSQMSASNGAD